MYNKEMKVKKIKINKIKELKEEVKLKIKDPRQNHKIKYKIWDIVIVTILAVLGNCNDWKEIEDFGKYRKKWLRKSLLLTGGIPSALTYERVIGIVDKRVLNEIFVEFCKRAKEVKGKQKFKDIFSFDGKVDRGSARRKTMYSEEIKPLNVLNVYSDRLGMSIEQEMIADKTNEIPMIPEIIKRLDLKGVICTWDALNTQKENVKAVKEKCGEYVVALKGNQGTFLGKVKNYLNEERLEIIKSGYEGSYLCKVEKTHGKIIKYEYYQTEKITWYIGKEKWEGIKSIGAVKKSVDTGEEQYVEKRYYISSLMLDIEMFSNAIRKHWNVENKLHWQLDFTFKCDKNGTVNKKALFNLQLIKKFALGILSGVQGKYKGKSIKRIRNIIALNTEEELEKIFANFEGIENL